MNPKEKRIKEIRLTEAINKKYFGTSSKFATILMNLGRSIIKQEDLSDFYTKNETINLYDFDQSEEKTIPELSEDVVEKTVGLHFACHEKLEIIYIIEDREIRVYQEGYKVYEEISGDLRCFIPNEKWEKTIEKYYKIAKDKQKQKIEKIKEKNIIKKEKEKATLLKRLRKFWGI